ncbi:thioredoxin family protein [Dokdonia sinensis]|uniref:Thioredoxin family protein n=1 Tax=Dokdonia sinensis TaxID=2479847 RepID=A0A3M0G3D0_9FLAO|nr:thioredoxin family protein [Dokdonia sinensis]RMB59490.1 thioredoxin family protein [Dokdonia sinensis]
MKRITLILFLFVAFGVQSQEAEWLTDFEKAKKTAQKQKKPILMYFTGSDWCGPCKMLKKDFWQSEEFVAQSNDFVLLEVDVPFRLDVISESQMKKNKALQAKYNKEKSFPTLLALDASGRVKDKISAYSMLRDTAPYFAFIDKARSIR